MNTIWKFPLLAADEQVVPMPLGAVILTVQVQQEGMPCLWAIVNPEAELEDRTILMMGTGHFRPELDGLSDRVDIDRQLRARVYNNGYIGTVQMMGGQLVFHFFEKRSGP